MTVTEAALVLADGSVFEGELLGAEPPNGVASGEVVFNTVLTGYQEVITDPSYAGQIITFTYPHIGNYGVNAADFESRAAVLPRRHRARAGPTAQQPAQPRPTSTRCCARYGISGIAGIDTRRLTRLLRDTGRDARRVRHRRRGDAARPRRPPSRAPTASTSSPRSPRAAPYTVGDRRRAVRRSSPTTSASSARSCATSPALGTVEVVPASTPAADVLARQPDGVFLSNGPGDPARCGYAVDDHRASCSARCRCSASASATSCSAGRSAARPSSCRSATTAATTRCGTLPTGHGRDHQPEPQLRRRRRQPRPAAPTSPTSTSTTAPSRACACSTTPAFSVQYHPEAGPGPHDARYLFDEFAELMDGDRWRVPPVPPTARIPTLPTAGSGPDAQAHRHPHRS